MSAPKHSPTEKERVLRSVARWDGFGYTQEQIALKLVEEGFAQVTQPMISRYLSEIRERYAQATMIDRATKVQEMLNSLREMRAEAMEAWLASKKNTHKRVEKKTPTVSIDLSGLGRGKKGKRNRGDEPEFTPAERELLISEIVETVEGRLPASEYLYVILDTMKQERALLGLDQPVKQAIMGAVGVGALPDGFWDRIQGMGPEEDRVQQRIKQLGQQALKDKQK